jgi:hypothetical protein
MSIAELIMTGTQRASKSTDWVADSLAKLGDNVSKVLREREQQKQAQEMLPMFQQSMQESMKLAQTGDTAAAYSNMMGLFASNPNLMKNQAALPFITMGLKGIDESATRYKELQDYNLKKAYYDKVTAGKTGGGNDGGDGSNFSRRFNQARGRGRLPVVDVLLPGETSAEADFYQQTDMPQGQGGAPQGAATQGFSFGAGAYQPSEQTLQQFAEYSDQYDTAKPKQKKAIEAQRTIVYDNQDALGKDISNLDNDQFGFTQVVAGAADPTFFGIKFARFKQGDINAKGEPTYKANDDAAASIGKLQEAFNLVNDRPELKDIYTKAGGWKNIELKPTAAKKAAVDELNNTPAMFEVINKKNPNEKVEVTQDEFTLLGSINKMIPTSQTNDMEIIRVGEEKGEQPTAAPAPTQGGLPATQPPPAAEIPDAKGNPFAAQIKKIQTTETEKNKNAVKEEIDFVVKTASRLSEALTGLSKGEYPKTLEYLPRAKQEALKGSSLENLRTEYNTLANLKEAIDYIKNNPNTPEAAQAVKVIKQKLGI